MKTIIAGSRSIIEYDSVLHAVCDWAKTLVRYVQS